MGKLNDDELENVSGGHASENSQLAGTLGYFPDPVYLERKLLEFDIGSNLSDYEPNEYYDNHTGERLTHEEVMKLIESKKKK